MSARAHPDWLTAFVDSPAADRAETFWCHVTGGTLSARREVQFATVEPPTGTACLRVQRFPDDRVHLDLHVDDLEAWAATAAGLGAVVLERLGHIVLRSPGGFVFCLVAAAAAAATTRRHRRRGRRAGQPRCRHRQPPGRDRPT